MAAGGGPSFRYLSCVQRLMLFLFVSGFMAPPSFSQTAPDSRPAFEVYGLASGMKTVDASGTIVIKNPAPNQTPGFRPSGLASGVRTGFVWRHENIGLLADLGYHSYSDHRRSTSLAPFMAGLRSYSEEHFRTSFFARGMAGGYRWTLNSGNVNFTTVKGIVSAGGGMDMRLTRRLVWRVCEIQIAIAGARTGSLLSGGPSTGIVYRFRER
jgi:hypothetical protein